MVQGAVVKMLHM